jgi:hypothetical protein
MRHPGDNSAEGEEPPETGGPVRTLPERYTVRESDNRRFLICFEAPHIAVYVEPGFTASASAARKAPPCTIFLDGAAQSEPFMDLEKQIYNFDHHEGCVRAFMLATCEQVLVMILKGLDLRGRDWQIHANEPDLDTVLAIWLILNHARVQQKDFGGLARLCALVRLEGLIDAHGLEMTALSGLPPRPLLKTKKMIDYLRAEEVDLKSKGLWRDNDFLQYTALILHKVDRIIYKSEELDDVKDVQELARTEIGKNRIAVAVETRLGIYELEPYLNRMYGESLGVVFLKKDNGMYTIRSWDPFMPGDLNAVYKILNFNDPAVRGRADGDGWGGSAEIGGSPRESGTKLTPQQIVKACREAFQKPRPGRNPIRFIHSLMLTSAIVGAAAACQSYLPSPAWLRSPALRSLWAETDFIFFAALLLFSAVGLAILAHRRPWQFGIAAPAGKSWWVVFPFVFLSTLAIGFYFPYKGMGVAGTFEKIIYFVAALPLASEILFRSLTHGIMVSANNVQRPGGRWFFSFPSVAAASQYAVFLAFHLLWPDNSLKELQAAAAVECLALGCVLGLASGFVRERSQSVFPAILFHALGMAVFLVY